MRKSNVASSLFQYDWHLCFGTSYEPKRDKDNYYFHNSKLLYSIFSRILLNSKYLLYIPFNVY